MSTRLVRLLAACSLAAGAALAGAAAVPASAVPGPTFTKIATPKHNLIFRYNGKVAPSANTFTVAGTASAGIPTVDIDCIFSDIHGPEVQQLASSVPVSGSGKFTAIASFADVSVGLTINCRLRAVPSGMTIDETTYLGSFAGPILYVNGVSPMKLGPTVYGFVGTGQQGDGIGEITSASECGTAAVVTIELPDMNGGDRGNLNCAYALPGTNVTTSGEPTASAIKVDGHNAYLPGSVHDFLNVTPQSLGLPQPALTVTVARPNNKGDVMITETAPLKRCSPSNTYPPTTTSCTSLVNTGVTFKRVSLIFRGAHQVRVRDTFIGNGSAHTVSVQYEGSITAKLTGAPGYTFPGHGGTFHRSSLGQTVTHLGGKAGTMFVRSDMFATADDNLADTYAYSWSRAPQKIQFDGAQENVYALPYTVRVPAHGSGYLGFAYSEHLTTAAVKPLAGLAVGDMINAPTISSPGNHQTIRGKSTTVKGSVSLGANGLPTSVAVNGHAAHVTRVSASKANYSVAFTEPIGSHKITVVAKDAAGNTARKSISVKNV